MNNLFNLNRSPDFVIEVLIKIMSLDEKIIDGNTLEFRAGPIIDQPFLDLLVGAYKTLILDRESETYEYIQINFISIKLQEPEFGESQDFDLVLLSYLAMIKISFPSIQVNIYYPKPPKGVNAGKIFYQLLQHNNHLKILTGKELIGIYLGNRLSAAKDINASESYLPPLVITETSNFNIFSEPENKSLHLTRYRRLAKKIEANKATKYSEGFKEIKSAYRQALGEVKNWKGRDLCGLYLLDTLSRLPITAFALFNAEEEEEASTHLPRRIAALVKHVLDTEKIWEFSDVEIYCLSMLIRPGQFQKLPETELEAQIRFPELFDKVYKSPNREQRHAIAERFLASLEYNLRQTISKCKDIAYGLFELAKNIVEHTKEGTGVITARIFNYQRLRRIKRIDPNWISQFPDTSGFIDINVIDAGLVGISSSYLENLSNESSALSLGDGNDKEVQILKDEYEDDLEQLKNFQLNNFFDFNTVKLFHQINRIKARLGLLIFSQTILSERKAFIKVASNDITETLPIGYAMYEKGGLIEQNDMGDFYRLGTNYNFIIPTSNLFAIPKAKPENLYREGSMPSSVFLEFQDIDTKDGHNLKYFNLDNSHKTEDKYQKLDDLKRDIGQPNGNELIVLDAQDLGLTLYNSSDWVRFLANLQFSSNPIRDIIITGMELHLYVEIIRILKLFDRVNNNNTGFWKENRHVLFFIPIFNETGRFDKATGMAEQDVFWFNSLLCGINYQQFINANFEINLSHNNLIKVTENVDKNISIQPIEFSGPLFSSNGKLLNFELLITDKMGVSLFEQTTRSLINIEIKDALSWK